MPSLCLNLAFGFRSHCLSPSHIPLVAHHNSTILFTVEAIVKIIGLGFYEGPGAYVRDAWNCFDFIIVVSGLVKYVTSALINTLTTNNNVHVVRGFCY